MLQGLCKVPYVKVLLPYDDVTVYLLCTHKENYGTMHAPYQFCESRTHVQTPSWSIQFLYAWHTARELDALQYKTRPNIRPCQPVVYLPTRVIFVYIRVPLIEVTSYDHTIRTCRYFATIFQAEHVAMRKCVQPETTQNSMQKQVVRRDGEQIVVRGVPQCRSNFAGALYTILPRYIWSWVLVCQPHTFCLLFIRQFYVIVPNSNI